jgi:glycosyltransferase involved in cell wall biosynthesis
VKNLSVTIIGFNEADHLKELLPTLHWADEIIYVDCGSSDDSAKIAGENNCKIFSRPNNPNLNINKSFAIEQAESEWIFYLDPDERVSDLLAKEILTSIHQPGNNRAFLVKRRNHYFGKWLRHGSQYPDYQLRLFKRGYGRFPLKHVHERLVIDGEVGQLESDLLHYSYKTISQFLCKFDFYTEFEANFLYQQGLRSSWHMAIRYLFLLPSIRFFRRYIFKMGFRDGWQGLFAAIFDALNFVIRYFKLKEKSAV